MMKRYFSILMIAFIFSACDKPDSPYLPGQTDLGTAEGVIQYGPDFFNTYEKTVLLEDFTGYKCQNCGPAIEAANALQEQWGSRIVVVGYHVLEFFAAPDLFPQPPNFEFSKDFRTEDGEALAADYNILSLPIGLVNRQDFGSGPLVFAGDWAGRVSDEMSGTAQGFVEVLEDSTSVEGADARFSIALRPLNEVSENWNLIVGLFENDIIEAQKNGSDIIFPFSHQHVFRGFLNGRAGQTVITPGSNFASGEAVYYNFQTQLDAEWVIENCYVYAFLQNEETLEVYAVDKSPLM
jgi:hypothetical protein